MLLSLETLTLDIAASWGRLFAALILSVLFSLSVGILAATNKRAEKIIIPAIDVLQTIPILGFFPVVIYLIVLVLPNFIGVNVAVIFLIFTSMAWNIAFGVYEAVKSIPQDFIDFAHINHFSWERLYRELYIPASMPRLAYQVSISWSIGLFYLVTSEIFSTGNHNFAVTYGIGVAIAALVINSNVLSYITVFVFLIAAILLTRFLFLTPLSVYSERFSFRGGESGRRSKVLRIYQKIAHAIATALSRPKKYNAVSIKKNKPVPAWVKPLPQRSEKDNAGLILIGLIVIFGAIGVYATGTYSYLLQVFSGLAASFVRVWVMYVVCIAIAIPLGIKIAKSTRAYEPSLAVIQTVSAIPATVLLPLVVALFYLLPFGNELVALAIILLSMIWYMLFSVIAGMRTIPNEFFELGRIERLKWQKKWRDIYVPAVLPSFITGSITAVGGAWNALIVAEYFSVEAASGKQVVLSQVGTGIGKLIDQSVFSGNLTLTLLALGGMVVMVLLINRFVWQRLYKSVTNKYRIEV